MRKKKKKNPHASALGRLGGRARANSMTPAERRELASKAGRARAAKLSARRRSEIAKRAVQAREKGRAERQGRP
jgi:hypothetical protein